MVEQVYTWYWGSAPMSAFDDVQSNIFNQAGSDKDNRIAFIVKEDYLYDELREILAVCYDKLDDDLFIDHAENTYKVILQND